MTGEERQHSSVLVLFSGGQDSTVCLAWALTRYSRVETIGFDYGQRHDVELECRETLLHKIPENFPQWRERLGADHRVELPALAKISESAYSPRNQRGPVARSRRSPSDRCCRTLRS